MKKIKVLSFLVVMMFSLSFIAESYAISSTVNTEIQSDDEKRKNRKKSKDTETVTETEKKECCSTKSENAGEVKSSCGSSTGMKAECNKRTVESCTTKTSEEKSGCNKETTSKCCKGDK